MVELSGICDANERRLWYFKRQFGLDGTATVSDFRQLFSRVDAVILALPNRLHVPVAGEFLSRGIHVLCEKPLAVTCDECERLCRTARESRSILSVGYYTRFYPSFQLTGELIRSRFLGRLLSFDYEFGTVGGWESLSGYNLSRQESGGGVLVVAGSHFVDRMLTLFEDVTVLSYADDSRGGVEANCVVVFEAKARGDVLTGRVTLSKTHKLANRLRIVGERGIVEVGEGQSDSVNYFPAQSGIRHELSYLPKGVSENSKTCFQVQLDDFAEAVLSGREPQVSGIQAIASASIFERCYQIAVPLNEPWVDATIPRLREALPSEPGAALYAEIPTPTYL